MSSGTATIIGVTVGIAALVLIAAVAMFVVMRKRQRARAQQGVFAMLAHHQELSASVPVPPPVGGVSRSGSGIGRESAPSRSVPARYPSGEV